VRTHYTKIGRNITEAWTIGERTYRLSAEVWTDRDALNVFRWQLAQKARAKREADRQFEKAGLERLLAAVEAEGTDGAN
jgi:hypothetical protein